MAYIYVRQHPSYDIYNVCKLGRTNALPERDSQYATGEIIRGKFVLVLEVDISQVEIIERKLQHYFYTSNVRYDAGEEFYTKNIISEIEPCLKNCSIHYRRLSESDIKNLTRCNRVNNTIKVFIHTLKKRRTRKTEYVPRPHQNVIIEKAQAHFNKYDKGLLLLTCGVGKTLISLWIAQRLKIKTLLIGVPSIKLLEQWEKVVAILFNAIPLKIISGEDRISSEEVYSFVDTNKHQCIVITTYKSSSKVKNGLRLLKQPFQFDMKILDEVHHLTSKHVDAECNKERYIDILDIPCIKQLSLTATCKDICKNGSNNIISNDNIEIFGDKIYRMCLLDAIIQDIVCDYVIQTIYTDDIQTEERLFIKKHITTETDKRLFLSAFAALKSISDGNSHHLLIYSNNQIHAEKIVKYIGLLKDEYFQLPDLYCSSYHSSMKENDQKTALYSFSKATVGIITCVYCLGEGWDFPLLDGVVFAENMSSNIRIVQSALRACRKNMTEPNKKSKIIIPLLNTQGSLDNNENTDFKTVKEVIYQMGQEDEMVCQKIKAYCISLKKHNVSTAEMKTNSDDFGEYDAELTKKLQMNKINRELLGITYEKAKSILLDKNIKTKEAYYELCKNDTRLTEEPEIFYKNKFTDWIDYLSIKRIYYNLQICKNKVGEYLLLYPEIKLNYLDLNKMCSALCEKDTMFPPNGLWVEYYNVKDLRDIIVIINKKKTNGAVL